MNAIKVFNISTVFNKRKKVAKKENYYYNHCKHFLGLDTCPLRGKVGRKPGKGLK